MIGYADSPMNGRMPYYINRYYDNRYQMRNVIINTKTVNDNRNDNHYYQQINKKAAIRSGLAYYFY